MRSPRIPPSNVLSDALLSRAFNASPLLFQHADTTPVPVYPAHEAYEDYEAYEAYEAYEENEASEIESLKQLSINELLDVFHGNDPPPPRPSPSLRHDASPWDSPIWPPLPPGPPPPTALPSPLRELSAWNPASSAALAVAHRQHHRSGGAVSWMNGGRIEQ